MVGSVYGNLLTNICMSIWLYLLLFRRKFNKKETIALCIVTGFVCETISLSFSLFFKSNAVNMWVAILLPTLFVLVAVFILSFFDKEKTLFLFLAYCFVFEFFNLTSSVVSQTVISGNSFVALVATFVLNLTLMIIFMKKIKKRIYKGVVAYSGSTTIMNFICVILICFVTSCLIIDFYMNEVSIYSLVFVVIATPLIYGIYRLFYDVFFRTEHRHEVEKIELRNAYLNELVVDTKSRINEVTPYSKNLELNTILSVATLIMKDRGYNLTISCDELSGIVMTYDELLALFGNIIEFGIAVNETTDKNNYSALRIHENGNKISIKFEARCKEYIRYKEGIPKAHFINELGIKSIIQVVIKYAGDYEFYNDEEAAYIHIIMNNFLS